MSYYDDEYFASMRRHEDFLRGQAARQIDDVRRMEQSRHLRDMASWKRLERDRNRRKYGW